MQGSRWGKAAPSLLLAAFPRCLCLLAPIRSAVGVLCPCHPCPCRLPCAHVCSAQPARAPGGAPEAVDKMGQAWEGRPSPGLQTCGISWALPRCLEHPLRGTVSVGQWCEAAQNILGQQTSGAEPACRAGPATGSHPWGLPAPRQASPPVHCWARAGKALWGFRRTLLGTGPPAAPQGLPARPPPGCRPGSRILRSSPSPAGCPPWAPRAKAGLQSCHLPLTRSQLGERGQSISGCPGCSPPASVGDSLGHPLPPAQPLLS